MKRIYEIGIDGSGIDELIRGLDEYRKWLEEKCEALAERLAAMGALRASMGFSAAIYSGENEHEISTERVGEHEYVVRADGEAVLFVEFGSGLVGFGHPEFGACGPGTWPGKGHWNDPKGWWFPTNDPAYAKKSSKKTGKMYGHTYGNPPNMPLYGAVKDLEQELKRVVAEVFRE
ncbi:MAG: hypothetical protein IJQ02_11820 [Oscillospiraceae bacterium]|nr:hypothetical protein [Oscillospiraceae bacterium]